MFPIRNKISKKLDNQINVHNYSNQWLSIIGLIEWINSVWGVLDGIFGFSNFFFIIPLEPCEPLY